MTRRAERFFLFCNEGYGRPYEHAFRRWCAENDVEDFIVVRSVREQREDRSVRRGVGRAWRNFRTLARDRIIAVIDVNDDAFIDPYLKRGIANHGIIAGFNQIFREPSIRRFASFHNFHPSVLPYYRGPVPSYWCIRNGEKRTGVTLHTVTTTIDAGSILWQQDLPITTGNHDELDQAIARLGAAFLPTLLASVRAGEPVAATRLDADAIYTHHVDYLSFPGKEKAMADGDE